MKKIFFKEQEPEYYYGLIKQAQKEANNLLSSMGKSKFIKQEPVIPGSCVLLMRISVYIIVCRSSKG